MTSLIQRHGTTVNLLFTLVFILNTMSPLLSSFSQNTFANDSVIEGLLSDKILICTSSGYKYVSLEDFRNGKLPNEHDQKPHCPLCFISTALSHLFVPENNSIQFPIFKSENPYYRTFLQVLIPNITLNNSFPRAPPSYSFFA